MPGTIRLALALLVFTGGSVAAHAQIKTTAIALVNSQLKGGVSQ